MSHGGSKYGLGRKAPGAGDERSPLDPVLKDPPSVDLPKTGGKSFGDLVTNGELPGVLEPLPGLKFGPYPGYYLVWNLIFRGKGMTEDRSASPGPGRAGR